MIPGRRMVWYAGFSLIVLGIVCLIISDEVATGWWQGTLQAFGVGLIVGGLVDVLAISSLNRIIGPEDRHRQRVNDDVRKLAQAVSSFSRSDLGNQNEAGRALDIQERTLRRTEVERCMELNRERLDPDVLQSLFKARDDVQWQIWHLEQRFYRDYGHNSPSFSHNPPDDPPPVALPAPLDGG